MKYYMTLVMFFLWPTIIMSAEYMIQATSSNIFTPADLTIQAGDTVTWVNTGGFHNVVEDNNLFTSGSASSSAWEFSYVFTNPGAYGYFCSVHGAAGGVGMSGSITVQPVVGISDSNPGNTGNSFKLQSVYPNPFNPQTHFNLLIQESGRYSLRIFNAFGQKVYEKSMILSTGNHEINWKGIDNNGTGLPSGHYFYRIGHASTIRTGKLLLLK